MNNFHLEYKDDLQFLILSWQTETDGNIFCKSKPKKESIPNSLWNKNRSDLKLYFIRPSFLWFLQLDKISAFTF